MGRVTRPAIPRITRHVTLAVIPMVIWDITRSVVHRTTTGVLSPTISLVPRSRRWERVADVSPRLRRTRRASVPVAQGPAKGQSPLTSQSPASARDTICSTGGQVETQFSRPVGGPGTAP